MLGSGPGLVALVAAAWAGALAGAVLLPAPFEGGGNVAATAPAVAPASAADAAGVGRRIPASFGSISVDSASRLAGPRRAAGVELERGDLPLQVAVTFVNTSERPVRYSPRLFQLLPAGRTPAVAVTGGDTTAQSVRPGSAHRFVLRFALPPGGAALPPLELRDPGDGARTSVPLGSRSALPAFDHVNHTTGPDGRRHH